MYAVDGVVILALKGCMESRFCLRFCVGRVEENASDVCVCIFYYSIIFMGRISDMWCGSEFQKLQS